MEIDNELEAKYGTPDELAKKFDGRIKKQNQEIIQVPENDYRIRPKKSLLDLAKGNIYKHIPTKREHLNISFDEARELMKYIIINSGIDFKFMEGELNIINNLIRYFINDETSIYDLDKGLYISGYYGSGKSRLISLFKQFTDLIEANKFQAFNYKKLNDQIKIKGMKAAENITGYGSLLIDDIGFLNESKIMNYGNTFDLLMTLVNDRYEKWFYHRTRTFYTSNIEISSRDAKKQTIESIYGEGISGRLKDSCNLITYNFQHHR